MIGEEGILQELDLKGIKHLGGPSDAGKVVKLGPGEFMEHDHDVGAVVVGFDRCGAACCTHCGIQTYAALSGW